MHSARSTPAQIARATRRVLMLAIRRTAAEDAFTLIETLIASVVLVVGVAAFFNALNLSTHAEASSRAREGATNLAREVLEDARTIPYAQLAPYSVEHELQQMPGLASTSGQAWTIVRRGFTYTVSVSECSIDDPKDGYGVHDSTFCPESLAHAPSNPPDPTPADLKQVTIDIKWQAQGRSPDVHQVETLSAAGQTIGLSASNLHLISPAENPKPTAPFITTGGITELTFSVTAPTSTAAMNWELEGVRQSPQPEKKAGSNTEWTFTWKIPYPEVPDGTYIVTAQAIDSTGVEGPPVSITVTLLRGTPAAPKGIEGGFNVVNAGGNQTRVVELQWQANPERNVVGYRVYASGGRLVCPRNSAGEPSLETLSLSLSCIDLNAPSYNAANITYSVVALYHVAKGEELGEVKSSAAEAILKVPPGEPTWPTAPASLSATKNADGSVTLEWPKVEGAAFYRIYRGSTEYTSRYGVSSEPKFIDTDATSVHQYWVTAVSSTLAESSPPTGPVKG